MVLMDVCLVRVIIALIKMMIIRVIARGGALLLGLNLRFSKLFLLGLNLRFSAQNTLLCTFPATFCVAIVTMCLLSRTTMQDIVPTESGVLTESGVPTEFGQILQMFFILLGTVAAISFAKACRAEVGGNVTSIEVSGIETSDVKFAVTRVAATGAATPGSVVIWVAAIAITVPVIRRFLIGSQAKVLCKLFRKVIRKVVRKVI